MNKKQTIELIEQQLPGFYSPDQVINFIKDIEDESKSNKLKVSDMGELIISLMRAISDEVDSLESNEVVDFDSAGFEINYNNTIEIESIDYESGRIKEVVEEALTKVLHDYFSADDEDESDDEDDIFHEDSIS